MLLISVNSVHHRIVSNTGQAEQAGRSTAVRLIAISSAHAEILSRTERREQGWRTRGYASLPSPASCVPAWTSACASCRSPSC